MIPIEDIIEKCKRNDSTAQRLLYERYANYLRCICQRYISNNNEVKDIVHDSFIKIVTKINKYDGKGCFDGWVSRIAINTAIDHLKKNKKEIFFLHSAEGEPDENFEQSFLLNEEISSVENNYQSIEQANFSREELLAVIRSIPEDYSIVFNLFHIDGYSHEEIASKLGIGVNNSRIRLLRARNLIREELVKKASERINSNYSMQ